MAVYKPRHRHARQQGFGLIESVITLLIVSFGLLALAYMQSWGQRYGQDSAARTQATMIANELIDRIRVSGVPAANAAGAGYTATPTGTLDCNPANVSPANDRDCFFEQISERLPTGAGAITVNGNMYQITIAWLDRHGDRFDADGNGLTASECTSNQRLFHTSSAVRWPPGHSAPSSASCLLVQNWSLMQ